jgi:septation ring formation regulator EzrA
MSETEEELRRVQEERAERRRRDCDEARRRLEATQRAYEQDRDTVNRLEDRKREIVHDKERADNSWSRTTDSLGDRRDAVASAEARMVDARHDRSAASQAYEQAIGDNEYAKQNPGLTGIDMVTTTDRRSNAKYAFEAAERALETADRELAACKKEMADLERVVESFVADRERARQQLGTVDSELNEARRSLAQSEPAYAQARTAVDQACD